jgi:hypothetical protein
VRATSGAIQRAIAEADSPSPGSRTTVGLPEPVQRMLSRCRPTSMSRVATSVGLPPDTRPRDLRGSFASLLIYEGVDVVELAPELGHSPATCLRYYARVFEEFKGLPRCSAVEVIREARHAIAAGTVPSRYLHDGVGAVGAVWLVGDRAS